MESTTALLRIAARLAGATAALVAADGRDEPVAAWGSDGAAAHALLRVVRRSPAGGGAWSFHSVKLAFGDGTPGELVLIAPSREGDDGTLDALAAEIGAVADPRWIVRGEPSLIEKLTESVDQLGDAMAIVETPRDLSDASHFLHVNSGFTELLGFTPSETVGQPAEIMFGPQTDLDRMTWLLSRIAEREPARAAVVLYTKDRTPLWTEFASTPIRDQGRNVHHIVTLRDVSSRRQFEDALAAEKRKLQTTLAAIADAVVTVLADGRVEFVNAAAQRLLGIELMDAYGEHVREVVPLVDDEAQPVNLLAGRGEDGVLRGAGHVRTKAGVIDVAYVASRIDAEEHGTVVVLRDVTAEHRLAMRLSFEASHDPLTGLQNRRAFEERLEEAVAGARERGEHHAVGFLDLDRFKVVNDRFGHAVGDRLLREIGRVMGRVVRGGDVLARIGGDEFALLLANCRIDDARRVAEKMRTAVDAYRIEHGGEELGIGVSIGLAAIEAHTAGATEALAEADAACYQAKAAGRNAIAG
ncbi:MAG: diguanylate cyclase [Candidatus Eremiobacteraeota bacterium]|nr:diguanylate cyclase [Candidatus Eremiobacteraeota bacterium]MBV8643338.1 diguanylate cyclase [Candidatus Eremiobacteraeota bacterium]